MATLLSLSDQARANLLPSTQDNLLRVYADSQTLERDRQSIDELLARELWTELDDRFYRDLAFGTGGMRGRTIGKVITAAEQGQPQDLGQPEFPGSGTNLLNFGNVHRAVSALGLYVRQVFPGQPLKIVIAHDTRFFSQAFSRHAAESLNRLGLDALLFAEDRSTPQLSFSVRAFGARAGIMITASHNPPHDNGMKFYFTDGAQVVEPHASGITALFKKISDHPHFLTEALEATKEPGKVILLDAAADNAYQDAVAELVLEPEMISATREQIKFVYTPLHGTGLRATPALLKRFGFRFSLVPQQREGDGRFPTVKSPNPENAEALELALQQAEAEQADVVLATDPDADRMGVAVRDTAGKLMLLTGNQIGSILAHYRTKRLFAQSVLTEANKEHAAIIKTFVTTDLQSKIADSLGIACLNTLTGFKYIGEKMLQYELATENTDYGKKSAQERRAETLVKSRFVIFGGEESYGYTGGDYVRDKDGNAAVLMFAEAAAWAKAQGQTLAEYLDAIYRELGFYTEKLGTLTFEGASGAQKIQTLLASFRSEPPQSYGGVAVSRLDDFGKGDFRDLDGNLIPKETMLIFHLADGGRMAVRGSGTEPKIKFYFFTSAPVAAEGDLLQIKQERREFLEKWWQEVQEDVQRRVK